MFSLCHKRQRTAKKTDAGVGVGQAAEPEDNPSPATTSAEPSGERIPSNLEPRMLRSVDTDAVYDIRLKAGKVNRGWSAESDSLLSRWRKHCARESGLHSRAGAAYSRMRLALEIPAIILGTFVTSTLLTVVAEGDVGERWFVIVIAAISFVNNVLSALHSFVDFQSLSSKHNRASDEYKAILRRITAERVLPWHERTERRIFFATVTEMLDRVEESAPSVPRTLVRCFGCGVCCRCFGRAGDTEERRALSYVHDVGNTPSDQSGEDTPDNTSAENLHALRNQQRTSQKLRQILLADQGGDTSSSNIVDAASDPSAPASPRTAKYVGDG